MEKVLQAVLNIYMKNEALESLRSEARSMRLVYTSDSQPGYTRQKRGKNFVFLDTEGKRIRDKEEIKRMKALVLPPAWTNVWISPKPNGHLQATGIDAAGRKQYKYHPQWSLVRNERKHNRMRDFAKVLPVIRRVIETDLQKTEFSKEKVVALAVSVMDRTFIRVGNAAYTKLYGSFGLTSLRTKHLKVSGNKMKISFKGKKGVFQEIVISQARFVRILKKLKDIPGQELFQYYDNEGSKKSIDSGDINEYIEQCTGNNFTAKDFRTWWGTVTAAEYLADNSGTSIKKEVVEALDFVAGKLGNSRAVCKKYYVHPLLLKSYEEGTLEKYLTRIKKMRQRKSSNRYKAEEEVMIDFLNKECKAG